MHKPGLMICVDAGGFEGVSVYPANEATEDAGFYVTKHFDPAEYGGMERAKRAAEQFAAHKAKQIGADWGTNY